MAKEALESSEVAALLFPTNSGHQSGLNPCWGWDFLAVQEQVKGNVPVQDLPLLFSPGTAQPCGNTRTLNSN